MYHLAGTWNRLFIIFLWTINNLSLALRTASLEGKMFLYFHGEEKIKKIFFPQVGKNNELLIKICVSILLQFL